MTLVCHGREGLFGEVKDGEVRLNTLGEIVAAEWERTAIIRSNVAIDAYVVMPNHLHGIIILMDTVVGGGSDGAHHVERAHCCAPGSVTRGSGAPAAIAWFDYRRIQSGIDPAD